MMLRWLKHDAVHIDESETEFAEKSIFLPEKKRYQNIRNTHLHSWHNKSKSMREKYETQLRPNPIEIKCNGLDQNPQQDES